MVTRCSIKSQLRQPQYIVFMYYHFLFISASPLGGPALIFLTEHF